MTDEYEPLPPWPDYGSLDPAKVIKRRADLHVGAVAFVRDENRRVYRKGIIPPTQVDSAIS